MEDFQDAAKRHLQDAELLFTQNPQRLANASHLFGVSTECALKAIAIKSNPNSKFSGRKGHIPALFNELCHVAPNLSSAPILMSAIPSLQRNFVQWEISQRYEVQTSFVIATVSAERDGAKSANLLMTNFLSGAI